MSEIGQKIKKLNEVVDTLALDIIEQISRSEDEVSKALAPIFAKAVPHSHGELERARERRELGNPPGKSNGPIGDQLTWEQILTHFKEKKRLWIISRDGDYGTVYGGKSFLNHFLYDELCKVVPAPEVHLFQDTVEGIKHFVDTTGVKAEKRLTPEETEEIKKEEKSLPHLTPLDEAMIRTIPKWSDQIEAIKVISRVFAEVENPDETMRKAIASAFQLSPSTFKLPKRDQEERNEQPPDALPVPQQGDNEEKKNEERKTE